MQEQLAACSVLFDSIVEQLPLYGPALAKIKVILTINYTNFDSHDYFCKP